MSTTESKPTANEAGGRIRRLAWLATGAASTAFAIFEGVVHDLRPLPLPVFALLPDATVLAALGQPHARGQLPPRAVPLYNAAHRLVIPIALIAATRVVLIVVRALNLPPDQFEATRSDPLVVYVAGLAWLAHLAFDRAL